MVQWATCRQPRGRQFPEPLQVVSVIGHRQMPLRMSADLLQGRLSKFCLDNGYPEVPSPATTRRWAAADPGYPEHALGEGLVVRSALPSWVLKGVRWEEVKAGMGQESTAPGMPPNVSIGWDDSDFAVLPRQKPPHPVIRFALIGAGVWVLASLVQAASNGAPPRRRGTRRPFRFIR